METHIKEEREILQEQLADYYMNHEYMGNVIGINIDFISQYLRGYLGIEYGSNFSKTFTEFNFIEISNALYLLEERCHKHYPDV